MSTHVWPRRLITGMYWFLAAEFLLGAITKYWPGPTFVGPAYSAKFAEWGYPSWFRFVVATIELVCAVMLVIPRRRFRFIGAAALVLVLTGAVTTHIINRLAAHDNISVTVHLVLVAVVALANWPADWKELLRPWQTTTPDHGRRDQLTRVTPATADVP